MSFAFIETTFPLHKSTNTLQLNSEMVLLIGCLIFRSNCTEIDYLRLFKNDLICGGGLIIEVV